MMDLTQSPILSEDWSPPSGPYKQFNYSIHHEHIFLCTLVQLGLCVSVADSFHNCFTMQAALTGQRLLNSDIPCNSVGAEARSTFL